MYKAVNVKFSCNCEAYRRVKLSSRINSDDRASHEDQHHLEGQADTNAQNSIGNRVHTGNQGNLTRHRSSRRPVGRADQAYLELNSPVEGETGTENRNSRLNTGAARNHDTSLNPLSLDSHAHNQRSVPNPSQSKETLMRLDFLCPRCFDHETDILECVAKRQDFEKDRDNARPPHVKVWRGIGELIAPTELPTVPDPFRSSSSWSRRSQSIDEPADSIAEAPISRNVKRYLGNFETPSPPDDNQLSNSSSSHLTGPVVPIPKGWRLSEIETSDETWGFGGQ